VATKTETRDVDLFNPHDALKTQPGVYLDEVEREHAEDVRARVEVRDADYSDLFATAGTPLGTTVPNRYEGVDPDVFTTTSADVTPADEGEQSASIGRRDAELTTVPANVTVNPKDNAQPNEEPEEPTVAKTSKPATAKKATAKKATAKKATTKK
jgi:hypothetical protein